MRGSSSGLLYGVQVATFQVAQRKICDAFDIDGGFCGIGPAVVAEMKKFSLVLPDLVFMLRNAEVVEAGILANSGMWWRFTGQTLDSFHGIGVAEAIGSNFLISTLSVRPNSGLPCG